MKPSIIQKDYYRKTGRYERFVLFKGFFDPGIRFLYFLRKSQQANAKSPLGFFYRILLRRYQLKYGFQISAKTRIGEGLYLGHWGAIVINPSAKIGKNCNISHGVTIGQTNRGDKKGVPIIGDNVWIGANAVIVGGIKIGNNVLIAPNSYVVNDIPDDSIAVGNPARTMISENAIDGYINNRV